MVIGDVDDIINTTAADESHLVESGCSEVGIAEFNKDGKALSLLEVDEAESLAVKALDRAETSFMELL